MAKSKNTIEVKVGRNIAGAPGEVFDAWLNPKVPGTPWNMGEKLLLTPKVDGFFYWLVHGTPHYGRFTAKKRPGLIAHTWMSPYTEGQETTVTVTFKKQGDGTLMTLLHTGLPDNDRGRAHIEGWNDFMDAFPKHFAKASGKKKKGSR